MLDELKLPHDIELRLLHILDELPSETLVRLPQKMELIAYKHGLMRTYGNVLHLSELFQVSTTAARKRARSLGALRYTERVKRIVINGD